MSYERKAGWRQYDFLNARKWEEALGEHLGAFKVSQLTSKTEMDWWIPEAHIDQKEKNQPISDRWPLWMDLPEQDAMILDELSYRRALDHWPNAFFVIRDNPGGGRIFFVPIYELVSAERTRVNRNTGGAMKGKLIVDLRNFRQVRHLDEILPMILEDIKERPWTKSHCLSHREIEEV